MHKTNWQQPSALLVALFTLLALALWQQTGKFQAKAQQSDNSQIAQAALLDPGDWVAGPPMNSQPAASTARSYPSYSLLPSGRLLVVGGISVSTGQNFVTNADIFDPAMNVWLNNVPPIPAAHRFNAQLLNSGEVLVVGNDDINAATPTSYLFSETAFNNAQNPWTKTTGNPSIKRYQPALALLSSGRVLMAGGYDNNCCSGASGTYKTTEIYANQQWTKAADMNVARLLHTATPFAGGRVIVVGGALRDPLTAYNSAEVYNETNNTWSPMPPMREARYAHTATLLSNGRLLIVGGLNGTMALSSVELFDPANGTWVSGAPLKISGRGYHTATLLPSGKVLIVGGQTQAGVSLNSAELYDPATNSWSDAGPLLAPRGRHAAALLPCGRVIIAGGTGANGVHVATSEFYTQKDPLMTIGPAALASGTAGSPYNATFTVAGGAAPLTFSACAALPSGLQLSATGQLSGTPMSSGSVTICVKATDKNGCMTTREYRLELACPTITLGPNALPGGAPGSNYNATVSATGGCGTFTYSATGLPSWLTLSSNGQFSGTPPATGTYPLTVSAVVKATDKCGCMQTRTYEIVFDCPRVPLNVYNTGVNDNRQPLATGANDTHFTLILPNGTGETPRSRNTVGGWVTPANNARWIGPPPNISTPGTYRYRTTFVLTGSDPASVVITGSYAAERQAHISVNGGPPQAATPNNTGSQQLTPFVLTGFKGGVNAIDFVVTNNAAATGLLVQFREAMVKLCGCLKPISITTPENGLPTAMAGQPYSANIIATGGNPVLTYTSPNMPPGLTLAANGAITGTPMLNGTRIFKVTVTDAWGCTIQRGFKLTVTCKEITLSPPSVPNATLGSAYNTTLTAAGGCGSFTFSQTGGTLPPGVTLSAQGQLSGTPQACGTYGFTVKVTDKCGCMLTRAYTINVEGALMPIAGLFNTGVNNNNTPQSPGVTDNHYNVTPGGPARVITPNPAWVTSSVARWIAPTSTASLTDYVYTMTVDLRGCDPTTVVITGRYAADNSAFIRVNGNTAQQLFPTITNTGFAQFTNFTLNSSHGFTAGLNTITIHVRNTTSISGLLAEISGRAKCCQCRVVIGPDKLPGASQNFAYQAQLTGIGGSGGYTFALASGHQMPPGLTLQTDGKITGTPTACGKHVFAVTVKDAQGCSGRRVYELEVGCRVMDASYSFDPTVPIDSAARKAQANVLISLRALGNETTVSFSLNYDPGKWELLGVELAETLLDVEATLIGVSEAQPHATLEINRALLRQGSLGITISLPPGQTFPAGQNPLLKLGLGQFVRDASPSSIQFANAPTPQSITDEAGKRLPTQFTDRKVVPEMVATPVSAADYSGAPFAPQQILALFGTNLATGTQSAATLPLPTSLLGTTMTLTDSAGTERRASLFFVSPFQVNFQVPADMPAGEATFRIVSGDDSASGGVFTVGAIGPGLFTIDATGRGLPAAYALRLREGALTTEQILRFDATLGRFVPIPLDLGEDSDKVFLVMFGTGLQGRRSLGSVEVMIGETVVPVLFVGLQGDQAGLDQINVEIPPELRGRGLVEIVTTIDGRLINPVQLSIK